MYRIISFFTLFLLLSCSGSGIEGFVDEPITIKAKNPEEGQDFDFIWTLENQPDGSLISSRDLLIKENGQKIIFIPDYPGDYSIELIISKYGDEIDEQSFTFAISDGGYSEPEQSKQNTKKIDNEDWLNDEYEDDEEEYEDDEEKYEDDEEEYEDDEEKYEDDEEEYEDDEEEYEDDEEEYEDDEEEYEDDQENMITSSQPSIDTQLIKNSKKNKKSIAAKTDRFTIQITSKRSLKDAQNFSSKLIKKGYDVYIQKVVIKTNETWYRVRIGSYDNYNSANTAAKTLSKSLGFNTWVDFVRKEQQ